MSSLSTGAWLLYGALGTATVGSIFFSLQPSTRIRPLRNLTILMSFVLGLILLGFDGWRRPSLIGAGVGLLTGLLYFAYDLWGMLRARRDGSPDDRGLRFAAILHGLFIWPLMLPEVLEYGLTDLGLISTKATGTQTLP